MNKLIQKQPVIFSTIIILVLSCFSFANSAYAATEISGNITSDTTWTLTDSPYIVTGTVQVLEGVKLTIESGVEVKFNKDTGLNIDGKLISIGTSDAMVKFTSDQPNWLGIKFTDNASSDSVIKYSIIEYGSGVIAQVPTFSLFLSNSIIRNNKEIGITLEGANGKVLNNTISGHSAYGIVIGLYSSNNEISGNTFTNNPQQSINLRSHGNTISNNTITGSSHSIGLYLDGAYNNTLSNNTISSSLAGIQLNNNSHDNTITGNSIKNNVYSGIEIGGNSSNNQILRNTLESNGDGINFYKPTTIKYNNIKNNGIGIIAGGADSNISNNNIYNNTDYDFKVNTGGTVQNYNVPNNWWGTADKSSIASKIHDYYDDVSLGKVIYEPYALAVLNFNDSDTFSTAPVVACTSFTYSDWSTCQSDGTKTRTTISSSPNSCSGGNPVVTQSCTYTPPTPPACTSWTYSAWGSCVDSQQNRTITSSQPTSCAGGNPVLNQSCNSTPLCTESNWTSTLIPTSCPSNGQQVKRWTKIGQCQNGTSHSSEESVSCNYQAPTCTTFTYGDWGTCNASGVQSRSALSSSPSACVGGNPILSQSCKYVPVEVPNKIVVVETKNNPPVSTNNEQVVNQEKTVTNSQVAEQRKSDVASAVQQIIQITEKDGGAGEQVKVIAQTQAQSQEKLETSLQKVQSRSGFVKFFVGPNYSEINNAKKLLEQNREQIKQLDEIQNQITNKSNKQKLTEQVQLLEQTNQEIENSLNTSQKGFSLLGWVFRLFAN